MSYKKGSYNFICDICGCKMKSDRMRITWEGLAVCPDDWDPKPDIYNPRPKFPHEQRVPRYVRQESTTVAYNATLTTILSLDIITWTPDKIFASLDEMELLTDFLGDTDSYGDYT